MWTELAADLYLWRDSCNVYAIRRGDEALLVDAGTGEVADHLAEIGVRRIAHVLHTHHHRDQCQGSAGLRAAGAELWAPEFEAELLGDPTGLWQGRPLLNSYSGRSDRFSPLEGLPLAGRLPDYGTWTWRDVALRALPTPGHTMGSTTLLWDAPDGRRLAFSGDLLYAPGKVWSLATYQYDYNGCGGAVLSIRSLRALAVEAPALLLPAHGAPMADPGAALRRTEEALGAFVAARDPGLPRLIAGLDRPLEAVTPHLLRDRYSVSSDWVVLSGDGHALWIDYGYPHGLYQTAAGGDPAGKRPLLHGLEQLREEFGVRAIDAVVLTHHHDDHVGAVNALRRVTGAEVWAAANFAAVLERPEAFKTQCLWYDPVPVDRVLPLRQPVAWRGMRLTAHPQPGHTRYAACLEFTVDGRRALAIGDQFPHNYIYGNQFALGDYPATVRLWRSLAPELILPGHGPAEDGPPYIERFAAAAQQTDDLHRRLLPLEEVDFGAAGQAVEVFPYHSRLAPGEEAEVRVAARNPFARRAEVLVRLHLPDRPGWAAEPSPARVLTGPHGVAEATFRLRVGAAPARRVPYGVALAVDGQPFGLVEEGLVSVGER